MKNWQKAISAMTETEQKKLLKTATKTKRQVVDIITDTECYLVDKESVKGYLKSVGV
jgi:uncharacterized protein YaaN involved in tellurite resistance